jgi:hypothetical protein
MRARFEFGMDASHKPANILAAMAMSETAKMRVSCPRNSMYFVAIKMGRRQGGPSRTGGGSLASRTILRCCRSGSPAGIKMGRDVTDEQRGHRPIFIATLRAGASWLFFCVAHLTVMMQIAALRARLEKQPTDLRRSPRDSGDGALE